MLMNGSLITVTAPEDDDVFVSNEEQEEQEEEERKFQKRSVSASPHGSFRRRFQASIQTRELERGENFFQNVDHKETIQLTAEERRAGAINNFRKLVIAGKVIRNMKEEATKRRESVSTYKVGISV